MFFDKLSISELSLLISLLVLILLFLIFKWFFDQVRNICEKPEGFIKFGQITFILLSWGCFIVILIYYLFEQTQVNALDILLTVVVGFLGTIMGLFFSEKALESWRVKSKYKSERLNENENLLLDATELLEENLKLKKELGSLKS